MSAKSKYNYTLFQDELILDLYNKHYFKAPVSRLMKMDIFIGYPRWQIWARARLLGVARRSNLWTTEEDRIVSSMAGVKPVFQIEKALRRNGFRRSVNSIKSRVQDLGLRTKSDTFSVEEICVGFRVSQPKVMRWINQGKLHAFRSGDKGWWRITPMELAFFIRHYTMELEGCNPDMLWLIGLLDEFPRGVFDNNKWKSRLRGRSFEECSYES